MPPKLQADSLDRISFQKHPCSSPNGFQKHTCVRAYGECTFGDNCKFADEPYDLCIHFMKGKACTNPKCEGVHDREKAKIKSSTGSKDSAASSGKQLKEVVATKTPTLFHFQPIGPVQAGPPAVNATAALRPPARASAYKKHPCTRVYEKCDHGDNCKFADEPYFLCVRMMKTGKCTHPKCDGEHDREKAIIKSTNPNSSSPSKQVAASPPRAPDNDRHPCMRVIGFCNFGSGCKFAGKPRNMCLDHLKGKCTAKKGKCKDFHDEEAALKAITSRNAPSVPLVRMAPRVSQTTQEGLSFVDMLAGASGLRPTKKPLALEGEYDSDDVDQASVPSPTRVPFPLSVSVLKELSEYPCEDDYDPELVDEDAVCRCWPRIRTKPPAREGGELQEHVRDVFLCFREDCIASLRRAVCTLRFVNDIVQQHARQISVSQAEHLAMIRQYDERKDIRPFTSVQYCGTGVSQRCEVIFNFVYDTSMHRSSRWNKRLMNGALVLFSEHCFARDAPMHVGIIDKSEDRSKSGEGLVFSVTFPVLSGGIASSSGLAMNSRSYFLQLNMEQERPEVRARRFWVVESKAFYAPYSRMMRAIRKNFFEPPAMQVSVVSSTLLQAVASCKTAFVPNYLRAKSENNVSGPCRIRISLSVHVKDPVPIDPLSWPEWQRVLTPWSPQTERALSDSGEKRIHCLDETQAKALHHIFTHQLAIVEGTPGTGKTFTGAKQIQILLDNADLLDCFPILIVCETNHAVDAFLEEIYDRCDDPRSSIIRIGKMDENNSRLSSLNFANRLRGRRGEFDMFKVERLLSQLAKVNKCIQLLFEVLHAKYLDWAKHKLDPSKIDGLDEFYQSTRSEDAHFRRAVEAALEGNKRTSDELEREAAELRERARDEDNLQSDMNCTSLEKMMKVLKQLDKHESLAARRRGIIQSFLSKLEVEWAESGATMINANNMDADDPCEPDDDRPSSQQELAWEEHDQNPDDDEENEDEESEEEMLFDPEAAFGDALRKIEGAVQSGHVTAASASGYRRAINDERCSWVNLQSKIAVASKLRSRRDDLEKAFNSDAKTRLSAVIIQEKQAKAICRLHPIQQYCCWAASVAPSPDVRDNDGDDDSHENLDETQIEVDRELRSEENDRRDGMIADQEAVLPTSWKELALVVKNSLEATSLGILLRQNQLEAVQITQDIEKCRENQAFQEVLKNVELMRGAKIIAGTTAGCAQFVETFQLIRPKVVLCEEAAELREGHILAFLNQWVEQVIQIGDHKQLRPKVTEQRLNRVTRAGISMMERMVNCGAPCVTITTQRRMHPVISSVVKPYYARIGVAIEDHVSVHDSQNGRPPIRNFASPNERVVFLDCSGNCVSDNSMRSFSNEQEVEAAIHIAKYILERDRGGQQQEPEVSLTILSAYEGQNMKMLEAARRFGLRYKSKMFSSGARITTIDGYQGEEADVVIVSMVRTADPRVDMRTNVSRAIGYLQEENRWCVAMSRARRLLVVLCSDGLLQFAAGHVPIINDVAALSNRQKLRETTIWKLPMWCELHQKSYFWQPSRTEARPRCLERCGKPLACGHICSAKCHRGDCGPCRGQKCAKSSCGDPNHVCGGSCHFPSPCGKCKTPVKYTCLMCGGDSPKPIACSETGPAFKCPLQRCKVKLPCNHSCVEKCGGVAHHHTQHKCDQTTKKIMPNCKHEQDVPCHEDVSEFICRAKCGRRLPKCRHFCESPCGDCESQGVHLPCTKKIVCTLPCGHQIERVCSDRTDLPVCDKEVTGLCPHSSKAQRCGHRQPCEAACHRCCPHQQCTKKCGEVCDGARCDELCEKVLACGHKCAGMCGEVCPDFCRECFAVASSNSPPTSTYEPYSRFRNFEVYVKQEEVVEVLAGKRTAQDVGLAAKDLQLIQLPCCGGLMFISDYDHFVAQYLDQLIAPLSDLINLPCPLCEKGHLNEDNIPRHFRKMQKFSAILKELCRQAKEAVKDQRDEAVKHRQAFEELLCSIQLRGKDKEAVKMLARASKTMHLDIKDLAPEEVYKLICKMQLLPERKTITALHVELARSLTRIIDAQRRVKDTMDGAGAKLFIETKYTAVQLIARQLGRIQLQNGNNLGKLVLGMRFIAAALNHEIAWIEAEVQRRRSSDVQCPKHDVAKHTPFQLNGTDSDDAIETAIERVEQSISQNQVFCRGAGVSHFVRNPCLNSRCSSFQRFASAVRQEGAYLLQQLVIGFHGTSAEIAQTICCRGFCTHKRGSSTGQVHGRGEYFDAEGSIGKQYAANKGADLVVVCAIANVIGKTKQVGTILVVDNPADEQSAYVVPIGLLCFGPTSSAKARTLQGAQSLFKCDDPSHLPAGLCGSAQSDTLRHLDILLTKLLEDEAIQRPEGTDGDDDDGDIVVLQRRFEMMDETFDQVEDMLDIVEGDVTTKRGNADAAGKGKGRGTSRKNLVANASVMTDYRHFFTTADVRWMCCLADYQSPHIYAAPVQQDGKEEQCPICLSTSKN